LWLILCFFDQNKDSVNTDDQYNVVHSNVYTASSQVYIAAGVGGPNLAGAGSNLSGYNVIASSVDTSSHAFQSTNGTLGTENYQQQTQILSAVDPRMTRRQSTTIDVRGKSKMSFSGKGIEMQEMSPFSDRIKDTSRKRMLSEKSYDGGKSYDAKVMRMTPSMMNDDNSNASHASHASSHMTMNTMHSMDLEKRSVRQNHSEIEKRRRNKMNNYINELSLLIPTCVAMSRKMDKLTVLRLAVQHIKSLKGSIHAYSEISPRPSNLSDSDLMSLVLKSAADEACFLFVVDSGRGRILYVSESVSKILNYSQRDLFGQCLFDVLHPKDISKVKEQMSSRNHTPQPRDRDSERHSEPN